MKKFILGVLIGILIAFVFGYAFAKYKGYVLAPAAAVSALYALDKLKMRNADKKKNLTHKTAKKTGKRLASQSIAAGTLGTAAVVGLATSYAVVDHCEELNDIHEVDNLLNGDAKEFDFESCIQTTKESTQIWMTEAFEYSQEQTKIIISDIKEKASDFRSKLTEVEIPSFDFKIFK
jgi:uncharacterized protein YbjQ (UPF0145 family)